MDAAISLFRRGFHSSQSAKLQKHKAHAKISRLPKELTIEEYAEIGVDGLHIEEQFDNWAGDYPATNRVLFVNFNKMWENMGALAQQLGLPNGEPSRFFPTKKGRSERSELAPSTQSRLQSIYAPLKAKLAVLPDLYIREPDLVLSAMRPGTEQAK
ncbi:MAG: hypothetical protein QE285_01265 [Aquabacterium sp.]|nr:hypothetical protein [Aquabacterium sp.]